MTAPSKTAGNGTKPASNDTKPERISGMARVREAQSYHLSSLAHDAAFEAERLCSQIYRTASDGYSYLREPTAEALNVADDPATLAKAREALACLATAITYLNYLFDVLPDA
jgi:hypothetical protein